MPQATQSGSIRVMVVDDSAIIRGLLTRVLEADPELSIVASVQNGEIALKTITRQEVDVVVLDIEMPVMDGLTALPKLIAARPEVKVIMASTLTRRNAEVSLKALQAGAADYIAKPSSHSGINNAEDFKRELTAKVKALGRAGTASRRNKRAAPAVAAMRPRDAESAGKALTTRPVATLPPTAIAIGSSTGGPQALLKVLSALGAGLSLPIYITQHMPSTFTALLAENIQRNAKMTCAEGKDGEIAKAGKVYVAPGDYHMEITGTAAEPRIGLNQNPPENFCRPAVDPMLRSLSKVYGGRLLTIILTGMGSDGKLGAESVVATGGSVIAQDEDSSVVWGMPGAVATAGLCSAVLPLAEIAPFVRKLLMRSAA